MDGWWWAVDGRRWGLGRWGRVWGCWERVTVAQAALPGRQDRLPVPKDRPPVPNDASETICGLSESVRTGLDHPTHSAADKTSDFISAATSQSLRFEHSGVGQDEDESLGLLCFATLTLRAANGWLSPFGRFEGARGLLCFARAERQEGWVP